MFYTPHTARTPPASHAAALSALMRALPARHAAFPCTTHTRPHPFARSCLSFIRPWGRRMQQGACWRVTCCAALVSCAAELYCVCSAGVPVYERVWLVACWRASCCGEEAHVAVRAQQAPHARTRTHNRTRRLARGAGGRARGAPPRRSAGV